MAKAGREEEWAALLRAALGGDEQAYRYFLVTVTPFLRALAARRCAQYGVPSSETEDVLQEVLIAIHLKRGTWDAERPIGPWLSRHAGLRASWQVERFTLFESHLSASGALYETAARYPLRR